MSRGQWTDYEGFNLIELIDELKTRIQEPHRVDDFLHGMMIKAKNYYSLKDTIKEFLLDDDEKHTIKYKCKDCGNEVITILTGEPFNDMVKKAEIKGGLCINCINQRLIDRK